MERGYPMVTESSPLLANFDEPIRCKALIAVAFASISGLLLGYDTGVIAGALHPLSTHFELTEFQQQIFVGILNLGAFAGCFLGGFLADFIGRRKSIGFGAFLFLCANALMTFAPDFYFLIIGRCIAGVAVGLTMVTEPMYVAEISPAKLRGGLSTNVNVAFQLGIILGFSVSWALDSSIDHDKTSWRWMMGLGLAFPPISLLGVCCVIPESPRWLASQDRFPEAQNVLQELLGPQEAESVLTKLNHRERVQSDEEKELSWWKTFTSAPTRWLMFVGGGVAFFSQAQGIETIVYYSNTIFREAGLARGHSLQLTLLMGILKFIAILVSAKFVDSHGRWPLLLVSSLGMLGSMVSLGFSFMLYWSWQYKVVFMIAFLLSFSIGVGPLVYTLNAEIYPQSCRSKGLVWAMSVGRLTSAVTASTFVSLAGLLTFAGVFFFYAAAGTLAVAFIILVVHETKGTHLEDQDHKHLLATYVKDLEQDTKPKYSLQQDAASSSSKSL